MQEKTASKRLFIYFKHTSSPILFLIFVIIITKDSSLLRRKKQRKKEREKEHKIDNLFASPIFVPHSFSTFCSTYVIDYLFIFFLCQSKTLSVVENAPNS